MIKEIINLLPSSDLKAKIKETGHQFTEGDLLQIIYNYAPTFDEKLSMLERFSKIASSDVAALAKSYVEYEKNNFNSFMEETPGFVYELHIKDTPDSYDECYICASYKAALVCIDRFYEEYASVDAKETEKTKYTITKRKIFFEQNKFEEDTFGQCILGANKVILEISDYRASSDCESDTLCSECKEICPYRCDELKFPCFARNHAIVKYLDYEGKEQFGVSLCLDNHCDGLEEEFYVIPLDSSAIREHRFDDNFYEHQHIPLPLATLATPEDLNETMRKNYFAFVRYLEANQNNHE